MCYYFDDINKVEDFDFDNILLDEKSYENILIYHISCKSLIDAKSLSIMFDKVNGFIRDSDGTKYLVLFGLKKYDAIYDRIRYLIGLKSGITYVLSYNYAKIKVDSDDDLLLEKILKLHNVIILTMPVFDKDQNQYYYSTFLEKCSYGLSKT